MKWFLAFLSTNCITFTYATLTLFFRLQPDQSSVENWLRSLRSDVWTGSLFLFVGMCDILVSAFLVYHVYLVYSGLTTNESLKFDDVRQCIQSGELAIYQRGSGYMLEQKQGEKGLNLADIDNIYDFGLVGNFRALLNSD